MNRRLRSLGPALLATALVTLMATQAHALTWEGGVVDSTAVSCNAATVKSGVSVYPQRSGTFAIVQHNGTTAGSSTLVWARDSFGNELGKGLTSKYGDMPHWANVPARTWTTRFLRASASNCNGALPGHGNYTYDYVVYYGGQ